MSIDKARLGLADSRPIFDSITAVADELCLERMRQIEKEDCSLEADDLYRHGDLARAAMGYCWSASLGLRDTTQLAARPPSHWPLGAEKWKPKNRRRDLVRAGALIIAEIQRIDREDARLAEKNRGKAPLL